MSTPVSLRQKAQRERQRANQLRLEAAQADARAAFLEAEAKRLEVLGLRRPLDMGTVGAVGAVGTAMDAQVRSRGAAVSAAKTKGDTLFQRYLQARGQSLPEWVEAQGKARPGVESAKSWLKRPGKGGRPIPRLWADRIAVEFDDASLALPASWPNGIR